MFGEKSKKIIHPNLFSLNNLKKVILGIFSYRSNKKCNKLISKDNYFNIKILFVLTVNGGQNMKLRVHEGKILIGKDNI